jgi:hypothetical protein
MRDFHAFMDSRGLCQSLKSVCPGLHIKYNVGGPDNTYGASDEEEGLPWTMIRELSDKS